MDNEKIALLKQSFFDLALEMEKALADENRVEEIQYFFLRSYRLLSKANRFIYRQEYVSLKQSIEEKLSEWHGKLASIYENNRDLEAAEREWLASLAFFHPAPDKYLQYAHTSLNRHDLFIEREIKDNLICVTRTNVSGIMTTLRRAKFAMKTAEAEYGKNDQTQYVLVWIDCMIQAIEDDKDLVQVLMGDEKSETLAQVWDELNSLIGLSEVKTKMKELCDWVIFNQLRIEQGFKTSELSLHMIFTGHPGTGKTTVAQTGCSNT
jgi:stage V sporulation protein K